MQPQPHTHVSTQTHRHTVTHPRIHASTLTVSLASDAMRDVASSNSAMRLPKPRAASLPLLLLPPCCGSVPTRRRLRWRALSPVGDRSGLSSRRAVFALPM